MEFGFLDPSGPVYGFVAASAVQKGSVEEVNMSPGLGRGEQPLVGWKTI